MIPFTFPFVIIAAFLYYVKGIDAAKYVFYQGLIYIIYQVSVALSVHLCTVGKAFILTTLFYSLACVSNVWLTHTIDFKAVCDDIEGMERAIIAIRHLYALNR